MDATVSQLRWDWTLSPAYLYDRPLLMKKSTRVAWTSQGTRVLALRWTPSHILIPLPLEILRKMRSIVEILVSQSLLLALGTTAAKPELLIREIRQFSLRPYHYGKMLEKKRARHHCISQHQPSSQLATVSCLKLAFDKEVECCKGGKRHSFNTSVLQI